jgi:hypothetical protein
VSHGCHEESSENQGAEGRYVRASNPKVSPSRTSRVAFQAGASWVPNPGMAVTSACENECDTMTDTVPRLELAFPLKLVFGHPPALISPSQRSPFALTGAAVLWRVAFILSID